MVFWKNKEHTVIHVYIPSSAEVQGYTLKDGVITLDNLEPNPKNPIIAAFFRNIGYDYEISSEAAGEFTGRDTLKTTQKTTQKATQKNYPKNYP